MDDIEALKNPFIDSILLGKEFPLRIELNQPPVDNGGSALCFDSDTHELYHYPVLAPKYAGLSAPESSRVFPAGHTAAVLD